MNYSHESYFADDNYIGIVCKIVQSVSLGFSNRIIQHSKPTSSASLVTCYVMLCLFVDESMFIEVTDPQCILLS